ncbi:MAG: DNA polymerase III subunit beta [Lachnospiraceae bacterium]|nr:DNA polymerase III subunit beta [Lachnospiraceae bacterium]
MKVICMKEMLMKAMNTVSRAVPVRTTMDILKCVLLQAEDRELKITANDTALGIETSIDALVSEPGITAIDASLLQSIIRKLPDSEVMIESDAEQTVTISCEQSRFTISGRDFDDFVFLPEVNADACIEISQFTLREMTNQVIFSVADSDLNMIMAGVYVEIFDNKIRMTTLDGHRISIRISELKESYDPVSAIVPGKTFNDLAKILSPDMEKTMKVSFSKNHAVFEFEKTKMVSRLIEGEYFRVDSMIRDEYATKITVNKKLFFDCLDRSTLLISESDKKPVIVDVKDEEMGIRLKSAIGSMNETIPIEKEGADIRIAFNPRLLMDVIRVIEDEEITVYLLKYNYPCRIRNEEGTYQYVVLPVNLREE